MQEYFEKRQKITENSQRRSENNRYDSKVQKDKEKPRSFFLGFAYYDIPIFYAPRVD